MFSTVVSPNSEHSTSAEAFFVTIFKMAAIFDTQIKYMYVPCFDLNDTCMNLSIVLTTKKCTRHNALNTSKASLVTILQYGCRDLQHRNALFTITLDPLGRLKLSFHRMYLKWLCVALFLRTCHRLLI